MSDPEVYRRLDQLEETDKQLANNMNELTVEIRLMVQSMNLMQRTLEKLTEIDDKFEEKFKELKDTNTTAMHNLDIRVTNAESAVGLTKFIGAGFVLALIGLAVTAVFGGG